MAKDRKISGANGMNIIDTLATAFTNLNHDYLLPREDTVISVCTGVDSDGTAVDFKTVQNWNGTMKLNDFLIVPRGSKITAITLTSGSVQCF